jgi:predicted transcriptional regulator
MVLTVMENAYLRKAQEHPGFSEVHKKILFLLTHEKKYFTKDELFHIANQKEIERALTDLKEKGLIQIDGWLIKIIDCEKII